MYRDLPVTQGVGLLGYTWWSPALSEHRRSGRLMRAVVHHFPREAARNVGSFG